MKRFIRTIGISRSKAKIGMTNIADNMLRENRRWHDTEVAGRPEFTLLRRQSPSK
jgi:hypothetical protein